MKKLTNSLLVATLITASSVSPAMADRYSSNQTNKEMEAWSGLIAIGVTYAILEGLFGGSSAPSAPSDSYYVPQDTYTPSYSSGSGNDFSADYGCAWGSRAYGTCQ